LKNTAANRINLLLIFIITLSPLLSYFVVTYTTVKSGTYFFNALISLNIIILLLEAYKNKGLHVPYYLRYLFLFALYVIFSDVFIVDKAFTFTYVFKNQVLFGFLAALIIENTWLPRPYMVRLNKTLKLLFWVSILVILVQQFVDYNFLLNPHSLEELEATEEMERRFSSIYSYLGGTIYAGLTVIPVLSIIVAENTRRNKPVTIYYIAGALFSLINKSRWILVNLFLTLFARYSYKKINLTQVLKLIAAVILISIATSYVLKYFNFDVDEFVAERLLETNRGGLKEGAASTRLLAFEIFGKVYPDNPVLGKGNLNWGEGATGDKELKMLLKGRSSQIHVGFLSLFYWYGLLGTLPFIFFLYCLIKKMHATAKRLDYWGPFWGMMGFVFANLTLVHLSINIPGLLLCLVYNKFYEQPVRYKKIPDQEDEPVDEVHETGITDDSGLPRQQIV
jgi:hypothetical protein